MKVLIVIDMVNGFCRSGNPLSLGTSTKDIEEYIISRIVKSKSEGNKVVFVNDCHVATDPEIEKPYPPHCMKGSKEAEVIDELKPYLTDSTVFNKNTLSIFLNTGLEDFLQECQPMEVEVTGVCTDICDLFAVYELRIRGYDVFVSRKGVLPLDIQRQDEFIRYYSDRLGARVE